MFLMGTSLHARVRAADRAEGHALLEGVFQGVRGMGLMLSTWRPDTDLARLNASPPMSPVPLPTRAFDIVKAAFDWHIRTSGAFDATVGPLIDAWDLRWSGRWPTDAEITAALAATGSERFVVDPAARTVARMSPASWIDAGAFGKGAALREAERVLREKGVQLALLNFGGQLLAIGRAPSGRAWEVVVADPARRGLRAQQLELGDLSVATTSQSERFVEAAGRRVGHVLDPRTGRPVRPWGSVTVAAADPLIADILSTALFVLGPEAGYRWVDSRGDVGVLFLIRQPDGFQARWNAAMQPLILDPAADLAVTREISRRAVG